MARVVKAGLVIIMVSGGCGFATTGGLPLDRITLPKGFSVDVYARVEGARSLALGEGGVLYVGTRNSGKVFAVVDDNRDGKGDRVLTIARGLNMPNGVAVKDGDLYVAEVNRVLRYRSIGTRLVNPPRPEIFYDRYPRDTHHGWKFIRFGPDGRLYVPVGAPCNVCESGNPVYASITRLSSDGKTMEIYARGVRNTVGFDWNPVTGELWFTDNGRDWLGDNAPPDELNRAPVQGLHFGFPYLHGRGIKDPEFYSRGKDIAVTLPEMELGPHVAALGMRFYTGRMFPEEYRNQIFIAEHGSWNRSDRIGYRIMMVRIRDNRAVSYEPFASGWLSDGSVWGRPVDVLIMPDGAMLVSDDLAGAVYRITYK